MDISSFHYWRAITEQGIRWLMLSFSVIALSGCEGAKISVSTPQTSDIFSKTFKVKAGGVLCLDLDSLERIGDLDSLERILDSLERIGDLEPRERIGKASIGRSGELSVTVKREGHPFALKHHKVEMMQYGNDVTLYTHSRCESLNDSRCQDYHLEVIINLPPKYNIHSANDFIAENIFIDGATIYIDDDAIVSIVNIDNKGRVYELHSSLTGKNNTIIDKKDFHGYFAIEYDADITCMKSDT